MGCMRHKEDLFCGRSKVRYTLAQLGLPIFTTMRTLVAETNTTIQTSTQTSEPASTQPQHAIDPKLEQHLTGQDSTGHWNAYKTNLTERIDDNYRPWCYAVDEKFDIDGPLFPNDRSKVRYALKMVYGRRYPTARRKTRTSVREGQRLLPPDQLPMTESRYTEEFFATPKIRSRPSFVS